VASLEITIPRCATLFSIRALEVRRDLFIGVGAGKQMFLGMSNCIDDYDAMDRFFLSLLFPYDFLTVPLSPIRYSDVTEVGLSAGRAVRLDERSSGGGWRNAQAMGKDRICRA
jgi:hypothetical protein